MPKINWSQVPDAQDFTPLPLGRYPVVLKVDNIKRDKAGNPLMDFNNKPAVRTTQAGDEFWNLTATILDGQFIGRTIFDSISFGEKALKRAKVIFTRAGIIDGDETHDCEPDELDGTYWWVEVDRHEPRIRDGQPKLTKDGKPITDPRIAFAGYELMKPADAKRYREGYAAWLAKKPAAAPAPAEPKVEDKVPF